MKKQLLVYLLCFFSLAGLIFLPTAVQANFRDVPRNHWAYYDIKFLSEKNVIKGQSGKFNTTATLSRLDAAIMIGRAMQLTAPTSPTVVPADMKPSTRGYLEVLAVLDKGMFSLNGKKFEPNKPLTRKEMAQALAVGYDFQGSYQSEFTDLPMNSPYYQYVDAIAHGGVTTGYADGTFRPELPVNRVQFSVFLSRIYNEPLQYTVKQDDVVLYTVRTAEEAINLAITYPKATVHPVSNSLVSYSEQTGLLSETGIRNGVLVYNGAEQNTQFSSEYFKPYLTPGTENTSETLFDTFIVLGRSYPGGEFGVHPKNNSNYPDWFWYLEQTFSQSGVLFNLNESAKSLQKKVNVYISIPYPKQGGTLVTLDGYEIENTQDERESLVAWYMENVEERWASQGYTNINLKGYYWFSETMGHTQDEFLVGKVAEDIHQNGKYFIYSPHALSTNFNRWKQYGFDGAYLQPNTFRLKLTDTQTRLHKAFLQAQIYGSGINLEIDQYGPHQMDAGVVNFRQYIEMAHRYGLPGRSLIFFQGIGMVNRMVKYNQASYQEAYQLLRSMAYVENK